MSTDMAYIAGYFDGEGCVGVYTSGGDDNFRLLVSIGNTSKETLDWIEKETGFGKVYEHNKKDGRKQAYLYTMSGSDGALFLEPLLPYLREKKPQAKLAIEFVKTLGPNGRKRSKKTIAKRREIARLLKELKK